MKKNHIANTVELLYLSLMLRWERTAPPDQHKGYLDGCPAFNSQAARFAFVVQKIAAGAEDRIYQALSRYTRRNDGRSYISRDSSWMKERYPLSGGWYFEGCCNLEQKQKFIQYMTKLGLSPTFAACMDDFVAGKSIIEYLPTLEEQDDMLKILSKKGELDFDAPILPS